MKIGAVLAGKLSICVRIWIVLKPCISPAGYSFRDSEVWDLATFQCTATLGRGAAPAHSRAVTALLALEDGRVVSASDDATVKVPAGAAWGAFVRRACSGHVSEEN